MSSGVEFEEDTFGQSRPQQSGQPASFASQSQFTNSNPSSQNEIGGISGWVMRHGLAKSPEGAQKILIGFVIVNIIAIFILITYFL